MPIRRLPLALLAVLGLAVAACSGSSSSSSGTTRPPSSEPDPAWAGIDRALADMAPEVGFLAARVTADGTCEPVHEIEAPTVRPMASQFKLFVLGALAEQVASGRVSWDQALTVEDAAKSLGNAEGTGSLQFAAAGTTVSVEEAAVKMISISDNTAADMLIELVGRAAVEEQVAEWAEDPSANEPFLTTRQMLLLHYAADLGDRYLATPREERAAFLASSVDPRPIGDIASGFSQDPRFIEEIEWFASPDDVCRTFAGLQALAGDPPLSPVSTALSQEVAGIGLDRSAWPTVWYKGGSEPGVLTLGWLATNGDGETFVVEAMVSDPGAPLSPESITDLVALAEDAFTLLE